MYTLYMALHVNNSAVEQKVRDLASLTGESMTDAIGSAVEERMSRRVASTDRATDPTVDEILALVRSFNLTPINEDLSDDEILGYGPEGFCE